MKNKTINIAIYRDEGTTQKQDQYYREDHEVKSNPQIPELNEWCRRVIADASGTTAESVIIKQAVSFNGIYPPSHLCQNLQKAIPSIIQNYALAAAGFHLRLLPVEKVPNGFKQKGVDIELALTVYTGHFRKSGCRGLVRRRR